MLLNHRGDLNRTRRVRGKINGRDSADPQNTGKDKKIQHNANEPH